MRPYTTAEARAHLLDAMRARVDYWSARDVSRHDMCDGLVFSLLALIDGVTNDLPAVTLTIDADLGPSDDARAQGDRWYEPGMALNDGVMLHEEWYSRRCGSPINAQESPASARLTGRDR